MKKLLILITTSIIFVTGCNTVTGAGEDISSGGRAVSNSAQSVSSKL